MPRIAEILDIDIDVGERLKALGWPERDTLIVAAAVFGLSVFTYLIFITEPLIHNHASRFPWLIPGGIGSGRWFTEWIGHLHYDADLPIFLPVAGIVLGIAAAVLAVERWSLGLDRFSTFAVVAAMLVYPANLAIFYYTYFPVDFFGALLLATLAFYISHKISLARIAIAAALIVLSLASYQPNVSAYATFSVAAAIAGILKNPSVDGVRREALVGSVRLLILVIGGGLYRLSLSILHIAPPRSITYTDWLEYPRRLLAVARQAVELLHTTQPELLAPVKIVLAGLLIAAVLASLFKVRRSLVAVLAMLVLWPLALLATKTIFLLVEPDGAYWEYRYNLALGLLHAFSMAVVLWAVPRKLLLTACQAVVVFVLFSFVQANQLRQGILVRGQQHDLALANRILDRMETLPDIDFTKTYNLIRIGHYSYYRYNLMRSEGRGDAFYRLGDSHMDIGEISDRWVDEQVFVLLGSGIQFKYQSTDPNFSADTQRVQNTLLEGRRPWPAPESVFINGDEIIVYMRIE
jgi:hypothetical protein